MSPRNQVDLPSMMKNLVPVLEENVCAARALAIIDVKTHLSTSVASRPHEPSVSRK